MAVNGTGMRLTRKQVQSLLTAMENTNADQVDITRAEDGRLIVKQVMTVERLRALKIG
jgi:hypothetical protein